MSDVRRQPAPVVYALVDKDGDWVSYQFTEREATIEKAHFSDCGITDLDLVIYEPKRVVK